MNEKLKTAERISFGVGIVAQAEINGVKYVMLKPDSRAAKNNETILAPTVAGGVSAPWNIINEVREKILESIQTATCETSPNKPKADFRFLISETEVEKLVEVFEIILQHAQNFFTSTLIMETEEELDPDHGDLELLELFTMLKILSLYPIIQNNREMLKELRTSLISRVADTPACIVQTKRVRNNKIASNPSTKTCSQQAFYFPRIDSELVQKLLQSQLCKIWNKDNKQLAPFILIPIELISAYELPEENGNEFFAINEVNIASSTVKAVSEYFKTV